MLMSKKFLFVIITGIVFIGFFVSYIFVTPSVVTAPVISIYPYQAQTLLNSSGYVVAQRKASLSSKATGRLEWLGVVEGSRVKKGDLVALIESDDLKAKLLFDESKVVLAKAEVDEAKRFFERAKKLLAKDYVSEASYDESFARMAKAMASLKASEAALEISKADLAQSEIRAPFDAVVLTKNADVGDNITPFSAAADTKGAVVTIADMGSLEVEVDVSESNVSKIDVGQDVVVRLDAFDNEIFFGKVVRMVPTIDRSKATRMIKVGFLRTDDRILPDMSAKVAFLEGKLNSTSTRPRLAISKEALLQVNDKFYFFTNDEGILSRREISNPQFMGSDLIVVEDVQVNDQVVINPTTKLRDGMSVKIIND